MKILRILITYETMEKARNPEKLRVEKQNKKEQKIRIETAKESKKLSQLSIKVQCHQT